MPLIEDAAEALGATYRGAPAGGQGDIAAFSFNGNKIITTSGGGMLVSDDEAMVEHARKLSHPGPRARAALRAHRDRLQLPAEQPARRGRPRAARGAARAGRTRRRINARYRELLARRRVHARGAVRPLELLAHLHSRRRARAAIRQALEAEDIEARPLWKPMHLQPFFAGSPVYGGDVSARLFARGLCLPSGSALADADQQRIAEIVRARRRGHVVDPPPYAVFGVGA